MKKVIGLVLVMVFACSMVAFAGEVDWFYKITASDINGMNANSYVTVGTMTGYTDGYDPTKGEPGTLLPPGPGQTMGTVATWIDGAPRAGILDMKAPITAGQSKSWTILVFTTTTEGPAMNPVKVTVAPGTAEWAPPASIGGEAYGYRLVGAGIDTYLSTTTSQSFVLNNVGDSFETGTALTLTAAPIVPEPGSMLALGSGLVGLMGFAIRRRK